MTIIDKETLQKNVDKIHTTDMGFYRIKKNLKLDVDEVVLYCKGKILNEDCNIYRCGKNFYCEIDDEIFTINAYNYTIITAHPISHTRK